MGNRLAEMARMRLEYDEARKRIQSIQQQLADLEEKVIPGQADSDKDRYITIVINLMITMTVLRVIIYFNASVK